MIIFIRIVTENVFHATMDIETHKNALKVPHYRILLIIGVSTVVSWAAWLLVLLKLDPFAASALALPLFFASSLLALTGTFSLILFSFKRLQSGEHIYVKHVLISLRQGALLSICTCIALLLLMLGLLRIWNGFLLVIFMMLLEFFLSGKEDQ